jgi:hypothetical protein
MKYGIFNRILLSVFILTSLCLLIFGITLFVNFIVDNPQYNLDKFGITRGSYNSFFYVCDFIDCQKSNAGSIIKMIINLFILLVFWLQYLLLSNNEVRESFAGTNSTILKIYIKIIEKIFIYLSFIMITQVYQPMADEGLNSLYNNNLNLFCKVPRIIMLLMSFTLIVFSLPFHFLQNDSLGVRLLYRLIFNRDVLPQENFSFSKDYSYKFCRSPLRASILFFLISTISSWDIGKIIFSLFFYGGLYADIVAEEIYYKKSEKYNIYKSNVINVFIPSFKKIQNSQSIKEEGKSN